MEVQHEKHQTGLLLGYIHLQQLLANAGLININICRR